MANLSDPPEHHVTGVPRTFSARPNAPAPEDEENYRPGNEQDFELLYQREALKLTRTVYGIMGNREDAEDVVQEAFAKAYRDWAHWEPKAPARFWVQRIAINLALSRHRHRKLAAAKDRLLWRSGNSGDPLDKNMDLVHALRQLPVKQLTAVLLRFNHGYNNREIAAALGVSERAVGQRLDAGLARLKELMGDGLALD